MFSHLLYNLFFSGKNPMSQTGIEFSKEQIRTACIVNDEDLEKRSLKNFFRRTDCIANVKTLTCPIECCFWQIKTFAISSNLLLNFESFFWLWIAIGNSSKHRILISLVTNQMYDFNVCFYLWFCNNMCSSH